MKTNIKISEFQRAYRNYKSIFSLLSPKLRFLTFLLLFSLIFTSISELIGLASLIPLLNSLNNPKFLSEGFLNRYKILSMLDYLFFISHAILISIST